MKVVPAIALIGPKGMSKEIHFGATSAKFSATLYQIAKSVFTCWMKEQNLQ